MVENVEGVDSKKQVSKKFHTVWLGKMQRGIA